MTHIKCWCDGSSWGSSNPKKARIGVGVVWCEEGQWFEHYRTCGKGDNNKGELLAIRESLRVIKERHEDTIHEITLSLFSDSEYARIGLTSKATGDHFWRQAPASYEALAKSIKALQLCFKSVHIHWCKGHGDCEPNRRADYWAGVASGKNAAPRKKSALS